MKQKALHFLQSSGHYLLALLCAAVILLSALWTRHSPAQPLLTPAQADLSQSLSQITPSPAPILFHAPTDGSVKRAFSTEPVYFPETKVTKFHPSTDFFVPKGAEVRAPFDGRVTLQDHGLKLENMTFSLSVLGITPKENLHGQSVHAGDTLGTAAGSVPFEGENILCVTLTKDDQPEDISLYLP